MSALNAVQRHYTAEDLPGKLDVALREAGLEEGRIAWPRLSPIDQFHVRGLEATKELAAALGIAGGESFLDVGCGFGGPARFLAGQYGCHVTGIDLTHAYIEIARRLAERTGLTDRLTFVQGDALDLQFAPDSFDRAWTMHVGMNIADKERLYSGIRRVLKPDGALAVYDFIRGNGGPVSYPLPWASDPETSFLVTEDDLMRTLRAAGFTEIVATDRTPQAVAWMADQRAAQTAEGSLPPSPSASGPLNLVTMVFGPSAPEITANIARNLAAGSLRIMQVIARKN